MVRFVKDIGNPIFGNESTGMLFDVYVTKSAKHDYRMDLSVRANHTLGAAFSPDGLQWGAIETTLRANPASGWEDLVNRNCVVQIGCVNKMWYTGQAHGNSYIGVAESTDGLHFRRMQGEPVLVPEYPWEGASVMNPCVLYENGVYRMWYSAGETYEPNVLCYAESDDGIRWRKSPLNPILENNPDMPYEQDRIGGCQIIPHEKLGYLLFYIGYRDIHTACICCAYSADGITGFHRCRHNPLVSPDKGAWDEDSCYKPSALFDAQKKQWRIWYNGRRGSAEFIGTAYANCDFKEEDFES